ncbi:MAG TPA: efflux RND transporter periplasmic adaptor subunit [Mucilaginibacter sp.]|nr:efflux RND transporter periplasmic adaptor subunit [Mucilaginibacter sp.]
MRKITGPLAIAIILIISGCKNSNIIHPQRKNIIETVYASGKIMADSEYTVYALSPGSVIKKLAKDGDKVSKGQVLYEINNTAPTAKFEAANESYENARRNLSGSSGVLNDLRMDMLNANIKFTNDSLQYFRLKNLWEQNIGTKSALDNAKTQYLTSLNQKQAAKDKYNSTVNDLNVSLKDAKSQLASAKNELSNYFIRAESDGTVYQMMKEKGEAVKASEPVALLGKSSDRVIRLAVDQQDINLVKIGQQVLLKTDATGDKIFKAKVIRIFPVMNEADQTFRVDAGFTGDDSQPYIHTSVEANILIQQKPDALVIPTEVVMNGDSVRVKEDGHTKTIAIKTGIHNLDEVEVLSGLTEQSDVIVPSGQ